MARHYVCRIDVATAMSWTYLFVQIYKDSGGATDVVLQLFNQSLHLFNLHLFLIHVSIIVGIRVLLHFFNFCCQLYYLFCILCHLGLVVFHLK